ncbi:unnamed protein product, partial [Prorocentrum cordatum]
RAAREGLDAALVVYDVASRASFDSVSSWMRLLQAHGGSQVSVMLVGNKADLPSRAVPPEQGRAVAQALRIPLAEVSALKDADVSALLDTLLQGHREPPCWAAAEREPGVLAAGGGGAAAGLGPWPAAAPAAAPTSPAAQDGLLATRPVAPAAPQDVQAPLGEDSDRWRSR